MEPTENTTNELIVRIESKYSKLSKGQKRLADYVCKNYDKAVFLTAARLGEIVGVSESTVVRFATQLGYKGYPGFQKALEELGIPVILANPESMELLTETITMLGKATGAEDQAEALLAYNEQTKTGLAELLEGAQRPVVYLAGNSSYLSTAGAKMYQNTLIEMGGGENAAAQLEDNYWAEVSYEQLLAWNPDAIVIVPEASYTKEDLMNDVQLAQLDAVKNDAVYEMPSAFEAWDSPVPSAMLGSRWMAAVLHEAAYSFQTFCDDAAAFYKDFYGIDIDTALLTK